MSYYIYKFYNRNDELLYVGQTKQELYERFNEHRLTKIWWNEVNKIEYTECRDTYEMNTYEIYYIRTLNPKYNITEKGLNIPGFILPELPFVLYTGKLPVSYIQDIIPINKPLNQISKVELKKLQRLQSGEEFVIPYKIHFPQFKFILDKMNTEKTKYTFNTSVNNPKIFCEEGLNEFAKNLIIDDPYGFDWVTWKVSFRFNIKTRTLRLHEIYKQHEYNTYWDLLTIKNYENIPTHVKFDIFMHGHNVYYRHDKLYDFKFTYNDIKSNVEAIFPKNDLIVISEDNYNQRLTFKNKFHVYFPNDNTLEIVNQENVNGISFQKVLIRIYNFKHLIYNDVKLTLEY